MVAKARASDIAYERLLEMILDLDLAPGAFVNEQSVAVDLSLGRVPVREALARLAQDRLVTVTPGRGSVVTPLALDDVLDMFEAREAIQCGVAYIAATKLSDTELKTLRELVARAEQAREGASYEQFLKDDHAVHTFLVHRIKNPLLQDAADRLLLYSVRFWRWYWRQRPANIEAMVSHEELLAALEAHDARAAEEAMRRHLHASRQLVQLLF